MEGEEELSLELTLGGRWVGEPCVIDPAVENPDLEQIRNNFFAFRIHTLRNEVDEMGKQVYTRLEICCCFDQWVEKLLGYLDIRYRLCLRKPWIVGHVLPKMTQQAQQELQLFRSTRVEVYDVDTQTSHEIIMRRTGEGFVFRGAWVQSFVLRRWLITLDTIGLFWESRKQRFLFCVLKRAPRNEEQLRAAELAYQ